MKKFIQGAFEIDKYVTEWHRFECVVGVQFHDDDVIEWLLGNGDIDEEEAEDYKPKYEDLRRYAWHLIENGDGDYGMPDEVR